MMEAKIFDIQLFGGKHSILVSTSVAGGGSVTSDLHADADILGDSDATEDTDRAYYEHEGAVDTVESLVLAHACAGIDVGSPAYVQGLETTLEAIVNQLG